MLIEFHYTIAPWHEEFPEIYTKRLIINELKNNQAIKDVALTLYLYPIMYQRLYKNYKTIVHQPESICKILRKFGTFPKFPLIFPETFKHIWTKILKSCQKHYSKRIWFYQQCSWNNFWLNQHQIQRYQLHISEWIEISNFNSNCWTSSDSEVWQHILDVDH